MYQVTSWSDFPFDSHPAPEKWSKQHHTTANRACFKEAMLKEAQPCHSTAAPLLSHALINYILHKKKLERPAKCFCL